MANRKNWRASARETARWEREATQRMSAVDRKQRLKERILSAAREEDTNEGVALPQPGRPPVPQADWLPLQAIAGLAVTGFPAYFIAEAALNPRLHPLHWLVAGVAGVVGYVGGLVIYRRRGY